MAILADTFDIDTITTRIVEATKVTTLCPDPDAYDPFAVCYIDFGQALTEEQCDQVRAAYEAYKIRQSAWFVDKPELTDFVVRDIPGQADPVVSFTFTFDTYRLGQEIRRVTH